MIFKLPRRIVENDDTMLDWSLGVNRVTNSLDHQFSESQTSLINSIPWSKSITQINLSL